MAPLPEVQKHVMKDSARSVAILAQDPFLDRTCTVFFPFKSASGFALSKCLQLSFVVSHLFSWHVRVMERMCLFLRYLSPLRIWVLLSALFLTSRILNKWLAAWQPVLPHWKRMRRLSPVDPAQQGLGIYSDIVVVPQPLDLLGLTAQGHLMTIDTQDEGLTSPEDEQARSAVLLRFPCEQYHQGITMWINDLWEKSNMPADNKPVIIHCKAGSVSARFVFETRAKCQDFVARYLLPVLMTIISKKKN